MRAVAFGAIGADPSLVEVPTPVPGPGEVLVRVEAASVNGFDLATIGGMFQGIFEYKFPVVLGKDFAGTVEVTGEGVTRVAPGAAIFGVVAKPVLADGGFAEYLVIPEQGPWTTVPDGLELQKAAALGLAGAAAQTAIDALGLSSGETLLVSGATGGVGAYAVQLANDLGAVVIATARPGEEETFVRGLGARHVVDHTADLDAQVRQIAPDGVAAVLHLAGDGPQLAALRSAKGRLVSTLNFAPDESATAILAQPDPGTLDRLALAAAGGRLRVPVQRTYTLDEAPRAIGDFAAGTLGKLVVVTG
ncbi:NADP-dependent oxidoreductase [Sphaerisporangium album]|uniref:NADP-dependent oxidoreductase n=1 Tax=Sphaerisporangium album TaxID=509200 RepID=A0A367F2B8_9ACTN|nr:NADP-dependent oxidoreductase [Sphaerisporangium album]RCG24496.1 NADP-dependent oxidoreductase [Sphaerisporangium album]